MLAPLRELAVAGPAFEPPHCELYVSDLLPCYDALHVGRRLVTGSLEPFDVAFAVIEVRAFEKLQKAMKRMAKEQGLPAAAGAAAV